MMLNVSLFRKIPILLMAALIMAISSQFVSIRPAFSAPAAVDLQQSNAPVITSSPLLEATVGQPYTYAVAAQGDPAPTFQLSAAPIGMTVGVNSGIINWVPDSAGSFDVVVLATNTAGTTSQNFRVRVTKAVNLASCPTGMIAYWQNEELSNSLIFSNVFGNTHATCTSEYCPVVTTGRVGEAQYFDGNSRVNVENTQLFDWGHRDSFSVEMWVNTQQLCTGNTVFVGKYQGGSASWWLGCGSNGKLIFLLRDNDGKSFSVASQSSINDGAWHHVAASRNFADSKNYLYLNGQLEASIEAPYTGSFVNSRPINIGYYDNNYFLVGMLDEIALYNRALTLDEIQQHYQSGLGGLGYCASSAESTAPQITSAPVQQSVVDQDYIYNVDATGNPAPAYELVTFPPGMTINRITGLIQWRPTTTGTYSITVRASNSVGNVTQSFTITVTSTSQAPEITSSPVITGFVGQPYRYDVKASGNPAPTFQLLGNAPGGMSINIDLPGRISWTPSRAGEYPVTVRASNNAGSVEQSFTITVTEPLRIPMITSSPVTVAMVNAPYSYEVQASGYPTPTFQLVDEPDGMTIDAETGMINWEPEQSGNYNIKIEAVNSAGRMNQDFTLQVRSFLWLPTVNN